MPLQRTGTRYTPPTKQMIEDMMSTNMQYYNTRGIKRRRKISDAPYQTQIAEKGTISYEHGMENPLIQNLDCETLLRLLACRECKSWRDDI
eukprot:CAMPEP_0116020000 /NCGR_PEP_ID=MMETSP0321-20121206/9552_1 /TAXON_ID=163516 /ORGANISM="Leptocylindrus danicus var. danicus, Strain B650" /LENGTH=90 /DNA_ID=CAMNT_0003490639 /DNA_START=12 /DNA_END=281 /DNA_ORIENTATION=+